MIATELNFHTLAFNNNPFLQQSQPYQVQPQKSGYARSASTNNLRSHSTVTRFSEKEQSFAFPQAIASNEASKADCPPLRLVLSEQTTQVNQPINHLTARKVEKEQNHKRSMTPNSHVPLMQLKDQSLDSSLISNRNNNAVGGVSANQIPGVLHLKLQPQDGHNTKGMFNLRKSIEERKLVMREEASQIILSYICHLDKLIQQGQKVFDMKQRKAMIAEDNLSRQHRANHILNEIQLLENKVETLKNQEKWNTFEYDVKKYMEFIQKDIKIVRMNSEIEIKKRQLGNIHKLLAHLQVQYNQQKEKFLSLVEQINSIGSEKEIQVMENFIKDHLVIGGKQLYDLMITVFDYKLMKQKVLIKEVDEYYSLRVCKLPALVIVQQVQNLIIKQIEANFRSIEQQNLIVSSIQNTNKAYDPTNKTLSQAYNAMLTFEKYGNQLNEVKKGFESKILDFKKEIENLIEQVPLNNEDLISFLKTFTNLQNILNMFFTSFKKFHNEEEQEKIQSLILTHLKVKQEQFTKIVETVTLHQPKILQMESLIYSIRVTILKMQCFGTETQQLADTLQKTIEEKFELEKLIKQIKNQDIFPKKDIVQEIVTDRSQFLKRTRSDFLGMLSRSNANFMNQFDSTINSQQKKDLIIQKAEKIKEEIKKQEKIRRDNQQMIDEEMKGDMMTIDIQVRTETLEMFRMVEEIFKDNLHEQNLIQHILDNDFPYVLQITNLESENELQFAISPKNNIVRDITNKIKNQPRSQNQISYSHINNPNSTFSTTISSNTQDILQLNSPNTNRFPFGSDTSFNLNLLNRNQLTSMNLQDQSITHNISSNLQQPHSGEIQKNAQSSSSSPLYFTEHFQNIQQKQQQLTSPPIRQPISSLLTSNNLDQTNNNTLEQKDNSFISSQLTGFANDNNNTSILNSFRSPQPTSQLYNNPINVKDNSSSPLSTHYKATTQYSTNNTQIQSVNDLSQQYQQRQKSFTGHESSSSSLLSTYNKQNDSNMSNNYVYPNSSNPQQTFSKAEFLRNNILSPPNNPIGKGYQSTLNLNNYAIPSNYLSAKSDILNQLKSPTHNYSDSLSSNSINNSNNNISVISNNPQDIPKSQRNNSDLNMNGSNFVSMKNPLTSYMLGGYNNSNNTSFYNNNENKSNNDVSRNYYVNPNDYNRNNSFVQSKSYYTNEINSRNNLSQYDTLPRNQDILLNQSNSINGISDKNPEGETRRVSTQDHLRTILQPSSANNTLDRSNILNSQLVNSGTNKNSITQSQQEENVKRQNKQKFYLTNRDREDKENIQISNPLNNMNNSSSNRSSSSQITSSRNSQKQLELKMLSNNSNNFPAFSSHKIKSDILTSKADSNKGIANMLIDQYASQPSQFARNNPVSTVNLMQFGNPQQSIQINQIILKDSTNTHNRNFSQQILNKPTPKTNMFNSQVSQLESSSSYKSNTQKYDNSFKISNVPSYVTNYQKNSQMSQQKFDKSPSQQSNSNSTNQDLIENCYNISIPSNSLSYSNKNSELPSGRTQLSNQYLTSFITTNPPTFTNIQEDSMNTLNISSSSRLNNNKSNSTSLISDIASKNNQFDSIKDETNFCNNNHQSNNSQQHKQQNSIVSNSSQNNAYILQCNSEFIAPQESRNDQNDFYDQSQQNSNNNNNHNSLEVTFQQLDNDDNEIEVSENANNVSDNILKNILPSNFDSNPKGYSSNQSQLYNISTNNTSQINNVTSNEMDNSSQILSQNNIDTKSQSYVISPSRNARSKADDSSQMMVKHISNSESCYIKDYKILFRQESKRYQNCSFNIDTQTWADAKILGFFDFSMSFDMLNKQIILNQDHFQIQIPIHNIEKLIIPQNVLNLLKNQQNSPKPQQYSSRETKYLLQLHVSQRGVCEILLNDYQSCMLLVKDFQKIFN